MPKGENTDYLRSPIVTRSATKMGSKQRTLKDFQKEMEAQKHKNSDDINKESPNDKQDDTPSDPLLGHKELDAMQDELERLKAHIAKTELENEQLRQQSIEMQSKQHFHPPREDPEQRDVELLRTTIEKVAHENELLRKQNIEMKSRDYSSRTQAEPKEEDEQFMKVLNALQLCATSLNKASFKGPMFNPPTFEGKADESFSQFLTEFNQYAQYLQWDTLTKTRILPMLLKGRSKLYFQTLEEKDKIDFKNIVQKLTEKFDNQNNIMLNYTSLDRKQGPSEPVREYATDILQRIQNANITNESQKCYIFMKGLLPNLACEVYKSQPKDINAAEKAAIIAEEASKLKPVDKGFESIHEAIRNISEQISESNSLANKAVADISTTKQVRFDNNSYQSQRQSRNRVVQHHDNNHSKFRHKRLSSQSPKRTSNFNSEQFEHYNAFCRRCNKTHPWGRHIICYKCNEIGHTQHNCRANFKTLNY